MGQVNVNPGGYRDGDGAAAEAAGWSAAMIGMFVVIALLFVFLLYFLATQVGWAQPITIIQQPPSVDRTTVIDRGQQPSTSSSSSTTNTNPSTGTTSGGTTSGTTNTTTTGSR